MTDFNIAANITSGLSLAALIVVAVYRVIIAHINSDKNILETLKTGQRLDGLRELRRYRGHLARLGVSDEGLTKNQRYELILRMLSPYGVHSHDFTAEQRLLLIERELSVRAHRNRSIFRTFLIIAAVLLMATVPFHVLAYLRNESNEINLISRSIRSGEGVTRETVEKALSKNLDLSGVNFGRVNLSGINIRERSMKGANLTDAFLSESNILNVDLSGSRISGAQFDNARLDNVKFLDLPAESNASFNGATVTNSRFSGRMRSTSFNGATIENVEFSFVTAQAVSFYQAKISDIAVSGRCDYCSFGETDLTGEDFSGLVSTHPYFFDSNLSAANFTNVYMRLGEFSKADFSNATISGANFSFSNFDGSNFENIRGWRSANFEDANISNIINPPNGFRQWALERGAVEDADRAAYKERCKAMEKN